MKIQYYPTCYVYFTIGYKTSWKSLIRVYLCVKIMSYIIIWLHFFQRWYLLHLSLYVMNFEIRSSKNPLWVSEKPLRSLSNSQTVGRPTRCYGTEDDACAWHKKSIPVTSLSRHVRENVYCFVYTSRHIWWVCRVRVVVVGTSLFLSGTRVRKRRLNIHGKRFTCRENIIHSRPRSRR